MRDLCARLTSMSTQSKIHMSFEYVFFFIIKVYMYFSLYDNSVMIELLFTYNK